MSNQLLMRRRSAIKTIDKVKYLRFTAQQDGSGIYIKTYNATSVELEYRINSGVWTLYGWEGYDSSYNGYTGNTLILNEGDSVEWRRAEGFEPLSPFSASLNSWRRFISSNGKFHIDGWLTTLAKIDGIVESMPGFSTILYAVTGIADITIPNGIINFDNTLCYCSIIKKITVGSTIQNIGRWAFDSISQTAEIVILATTPPTLATDVFRTAQKIYVPYSADHSILNAYKTATNWDTWAGQIYELDENGEIPV